MGKPKKPKIHASTETLAEFSLLPQHRRQRLARMVERRAYEALRDSRDATMRAKMSLARQASEVIDKLSATDLRALQREDIARRMVAGVAALTGPQTGPKFIIELTESVAVPTQSKGTGQAADAVPVVDAPEPTEVPGSGSGETQRQDS